MKRLGNYELLTSLAKGGMGEIFLARVRKAGGFEKHCIVKTLLPHLTDDPDSVKQFLDEARLVAKLVHGNIVSIFDFGQEDGEYYFAMDYIVGKDLRSILKEIRQQNIQFPVELATYIVTEVCKGLNYAHNKTSVDGKPLRIVHRDISPSNILISTTGEVKIIDFGIARAENRLAQSQTGRIQGKFCYMSPEQAGGSSPELDHRSDIFSLGVVYYEMLTGHRIFRASGSNDMESLNLVKECRVTAPGIYLQQQNDKLEFAGEKTRPVDPIFERLDPIVLKILSKNPNRRFQTAYELLLQLDPILGQFRGPFPAKLAEFLTSLYPKGYSFDSFADDSEGTCQTGGASPIKIPSFNNLEAVKRTPEKKRSLDDIFNSQLDALLGEAPAAPKTETIHPIEFESPQEEFEKISILDDLDSVSNFSELIGMAPLPSPQRSSSLEEESRGETATVDHSSMEELAAIARERRKSRNEFKAHQRPTTTSSDTSSEEANDEPQVNSPEVSKEIEEIREKERRGVRRFVAMTLVFILIFVSSVAVYARYSQQEQGVVILHSTPEGAAITLDGVQVLGTTTPWQMEISKGLHLVEFRKDGYEPMQLQIDVKPGRSMIIAPGSVRLRPASGALAGQRPPSAPEPPVTAIAATPTPVAPASKEEPTPEEKTTEVVEETQHEDDSPRPAEKPTPVANPAPVSYTTMIDASPPAQLAVDGRVVGRTPYKLSYGRHGALLRFEAEGYVTKEITLDKGSGRSLKVTLDPVSYGCLKARALWPNVADIYLDGHLVSRGKSSYQGDVAAGEHRVKFDNGAVQQSTEYNVKVRKGEDCAIVVWDVRGG